MNNSKPIPPGRGMSVVSDETIALMEANYREGQKPPKFWTLPFSYGPPGTAFIRVSLGLRPNGDSTPIIKFLDESGNQLDAMPAPESTDEQAAVAAAGGGSGEGGGVDSGFPCPPYCG